MIEFTVTDRPGLKEEGDRAHVRGILLDQGRRPGHRPVACAARSSSPPRAGCGRRTSTMAESVRWAAVFVHPAGRGPRAATPIRPASSDRVSRTHEPSFPRRAPSTSSTTTRPCATRCSGCSRQGLPRQVLRLGRVLPVALRPARGGLPDRRHPHGRHERPRAAGSADGAQEPAADRLHHRPRRRADGRDDHEEGRDGLHREALREEELLSLVERMLEQARAAFSQHQEAASRDALLAPDHAARRRCSSASSPGA